jgi:hypothetical protein
MKQKIIIIFVSKNYYHWRQKRVPLIKWIKRPFKKIFGISYKPIKILIDKEGEIIWFHKIPTNQ